MDTLSQYFEASRGTNRRRQTAGIAGPMTYDPVLVRNRESPKAAEQREKYRGRIEKVPRRILEAARGDPRHENRHKIRDYVICRECGAKRQTLQNHLRTGTCRGGALSTDDYLKKYSVGSAKPPLMCTALCREKATTLSSPARNRVRRDMRSVKEHEGEGASQHRPVASAFLEGKTSREVAKSIGRDHETASRRAREVGLSSSVRLYDGVKPMTVEWMLKLCEATGSNYEIIRSQLQVRRNANRTALLPTSCALFARDLRDKTLASFIDLARTKGHRGGPNLTRALTALIPDIPLWVKLLRLLFTQTRKRFAEVPAKSEWQDWICERAILEQKREIAGSLFKKSLRLALDPKFSPHIDLTVIGSRGPLGKPACRVLAKHFGVGISIVEHCERARPYSPLEMNHWIQMSSVARAWQGQIMIPSYVFPPAGSAMETGPRLTEVLNPKTQKRGPRRKAETQSWIWVEVGRDVENRLPPGPKSRLAAMSARQQVSATRGLEYDTVARYHKRFLSWMSRQSQSGQNLNSVPIKRDEI